MKLICLLFGHKFEWHFITRGKWQNKCTRCGHTETFADIYGRQP